jgi:hypothetical protein
MSEERIPNRSYHIVATFLKNDIPHSERLALGLLRFGKASSYKRPDKSNCQMDHGIGRKTTGKGMKLQLGVIPTQCPFLTSSSSALWTDTNVGTTTELRFRNTYSLSISYIPILQQSRLGVCIARR